MTLLVLGLVLFLGIHSLSIVSRSARDRLVARLGVRTFKLAYSVVALVGFALLIVGYGEARLNSTIVYSPPEWTRHLTLLLMLVVFPGFLATYFPGRVSDALKHPTLVAVKAWALAHLLVNGSLAAVVLFGSFLAWAVADRISAKRRPLPSAAPAFPRRAWNDPIVIVGGLAAYVVFAFWLHPAWIGVAVIGG